MRSASNCRDVMAVTLIQCPPGDIFLVANMAWPRTFMT
jgi:hypothetical protein